MMVGSYHVDLSIDGVHHSKYEFEVIPDPLVIKSVLLSNRRPATGDEKLVQATTFDVSDKVNVFVGLEGIPNEGIIRATLRSNGEVIGERMVGDLSEGDRFLLISEGNFFLFSLAEGDNDLQPGLYTIQVETEHGSPLVEPFEVKGERE